MINIGIMRFNSGNYGGIEHQIINIVKNLTSNSFKFILITNNQTRFASEFEKYGKIYYIDSKKVIKASKQVKDIIRKESISILQSHMLREHYIGSLTKIRVKKLYHIFRVHTYINCSFISKQKKKLYHLLSFLLSNWVNLYLPINRVNEKELIESSKINAKKIKVVHNGVRSLEIREKSKPYNKKKIAMIANFEYGKGHDIAVKALSLLVKKDKGYNITFIGNENSSIAVAEEIKDLVTKLNINKNVNFLGFVENINEVLKDIDIIILPSYSEGTPNCLLEAMASKRIVIASEVGGIPEFIIDGKNGFLHKNKDYRTLAKKIILLNMLTNQEIITIAENGYSTWKNEYTIEKLCDFLAYIYKENGENVQ